MVDYPSTRSQQTHYHGQSRPGPSFKDSSLTSTATANNSSGCRPSDNPGFWTSSSLRTTYASYKLHPGTWEENYLSTVDDLKAFSFGRPDPDVDLEDKRWRIALRDGDETSSSSSDDGESRRRPGGRSRDVTPRASAVSLDVSISHPDTHPRSHPSQLQQINYYQRGTGDPGNPNRETNYHHYEDQRYSFGLDVPDNDEGLRTEPGSAFSMYSYDTGYDAASSYRSGSGTSSYEPSYTSSHARERAEAEAEAISISSSRPASSAASGFGLTADGDKHCDHNDVLSISSTRRSSSFGAQYEQYEEEGAGTHLYDSLWLSNSDSERISLGSTASSDMHLSISSLRFDDGQDASTYQLERAEASSYPAAASSILADMSATSNLTQNQNVSDLVLPSINNEISSRSISNSRRLFGAQTMSPSDAAPSAPMSRTRLRSLSTSTTPAPSPSTTSTHTSANHNASADFDLTYITSGLALSANALSQAAHIPYTAQEELDFVRRASVGRFEIDHRSGGSQVNEPEGATTVEVELAERGVRGLPMGWEDDFSIPTPFSHVGTQNKRMRAATITATRSVDGSAPSPYLQTSAAGTADIFGTSGSKVHSDMTRTVDSAARTQSFSPLRYRHRSPSPHRHIKALLDESEINSANGMPNSAQLNTSSPSTVSKTVKRKRSVFANLEALGTDLAMNETQAEHSQSMSPSSPVSPVSPARTIREVQILNAEMERFDAELSFDVYASSDARPMTSGISEPTGEFPFKDLHDSASAAPHPSRMSVTSPLSNFKRSPISPVISKSLPSSVTTSLPDRPSVHPVFDPVTVFPSKKLSTAIRSFDNNDSFARSLVVWGGPDYAGRRREWVIRKEQKWINTFDFGRKETPEISQARKDSDINIDEHKKDKEKEKANKDKEIWTGMSVGTEEVWANFLLGKFNVARDDVSPKTGGKVHLIDTSGNVKGRSAVGDANVLGFRIPVGKPPQQRLIVKHLREDGQAQMGRPIETGTSNNRTKCTSPTKASSLERSSQSASLEALNSQPGESSHPSTSNPNLATTVTSNVHSYRHDSQHPSVLVHKHSKVAAFSISRQHRTSLKDSKESSSGRLHVIMLAPRDVQEAFTNTATTKKLETVIDRHEAARAAFSSGRDYTVKGKDGKAKVKKHNNLSLSSFKGKHRSRDVAGQVKSDGHVELDHGGAENTLKPSPLIKDSEFVRDKIGTQSAPAYDRSYEWTAAKVNSENGCDVEDEGGNAFTLLPEHGTSGGQRMLFRAQSKPQSRENHKRAYGTLDHLMYSSGNSFSSPPVPSRPSRILKRFLPWDLSSPSASTSSSSSKATSITGSTSTMTKSLSTRNTTPTQSTGSDISIPYDPPWVTFISREQQEIQRNVFGQLEHSFEHVGLLPAKDKDKDRGRSKSSDGMKRDHLHEPQAGSIIHRFHKKNDPLSFIPTDAFFMLLPLWPAETDVYSQRLSPFDVPLISVESRKYLLVFYKSSQEPLKGTSIYDARLKVLLSGFRAIARQVSYQELQGTGIRLPEQGISVNGPLEDAFAQLPGNESISAAGIATFPQVPISNTPPTSQLCVIASSYSRNAGLEFDPEALIELGLCRILNSQDDANAGGRSMSSDGMDAEQSVTVKLTPVGSAVMEMVWVGGLALTSFGT